MKKSVQGRTQGALKGSLTPNNILRLLLAIGFVVFLSSLVSIDLSNKSITFSFDNDARKLTDESTAIVIDDIGRLLTVQEPTSAPTQAIDVLPCSSGEHAVGLFGSFDYIQPETAAVCFMLVIIVILILEYVFHEIHSLSHDTPFADMISAMEKELMIVGSMAFAFKLFVAKVGFNHQLHVAVEVTETIAAISAFLFCLAGVFLILMSMRELDIWSKSFNLHAYEIVADYYGIVDDANHDINEDELTWWDYINQRIDYYTQKWRWLPISRINAEIEFRVIHYAFCETFHIQRDALAFDEYVNKCVEKQILKIITIDPANWFVVIVLILLNWLRIYYKWYGFSDSWCTASTIGYSSNSNSTSAHRMLSDDLYLRSGNGNTSNSVGYICGKELEMFGFFLVGLIIFVINIIVAIVSRYYEFRILAKQGVTSLEQYPEFLLTNCAPSAVTKVDKERLSGDELKVYNYTLYNVSLYRLF